MAFNIGISFRSTAGYVTDPADTTYSLSETYPITRGGATFGWIDAAVGNGRNRSTSIDPRLAGIVFRSNSTSQKQRFRIDLPATGTVDIYCAIGDQTGGNNGYLEIFDDTTSLGVLVTKHTPVATANFYDATDTLYTTANWPGSNAKATLTFATTTLILAMTPGDATGGNYAIAHFRVVQGSSSSEYIITPSGGITLGGSSPTEKGKIFVPSGGISFGGAAPITGVKSFTITPSGGIAFSGTGSMTSSNAVTYIITPSGGINLAGSSTMIKTHIQIPLGGIVFGGSAPISSNTVISTVTTRLPLTGVGG